MFDTTALLRLIESYRDPKFEEVFSLFTLAETLVVEHFDGTNLYFVIIDRAVASHLISALESRLAEKLVDALHIEDEELAHLAVTALGNICSIGT